MFSDSVEYATQVAHHRDDAGFLYRSHSETCWQREPETTVAVNDCELMWGFLENDLANAVGAVIHVNWHCHVFLRGLSELNCYRMSIVGLTGPDYGYAFQTLYPGGRMQDR